MLESACTFLISVISQSCIFLVFTLLLYLLSPFIPNIGMHILPTVLGGAYKETLFTDQKLLSLVIISFLLITLMCDSG